MTTTPPQLQNRTPTFPEVQQAVDRARALTAKHWLSRAPADLAPRALARPGYETMLLYRLVARSTVEESLAGLAAEGIDPAAPGAFALDTLEGYPTKSLLEMEREVLTEDDRYAGGFCVVRAEVWSLDGETHLDDEDRTFGWFPIIEPMVPKGVPLPTYDYEPKP